MQEKHIKQIVVQLTFLLVWQVSNIKLEENPDANFSNFEKSNDICNKCECTTFSNYFILNCVKKDIQHTFSNWPNHQNRTLKATFSYNLITSLEKFPATNCSASITLDHCGIKYLAPGLFENMKNIEYVDLSHNKITVEELSSEKFKGPFNDQENEPIELTHLNLAYNEIHTLPKSLFEHTPRLKYLNLYGNNLRILDLQTQAALSTVPNLEQLNLGNNALKKLPDQLFNTLNKLLYVDLSKNELTNVPEILNTATTLQVLLLDSNPIFELTNGDFNGLSNLQELSLNNLSNVVEIHSYTFSPLKKLRKLKISNNRDLEIIEPNAFGDAENLNLKEIYMNNNSLMDIPSVLLNWSQLEIVEFNDNPLICSCNLYNISKMLSLRITRNKAGPHCIGEEEISRQVFSLNEKVCEKNYISNYSFRNNVYKKHFSLIRVSLLAMSLVALTATFVVGIVWFLRYKKYGLQSSSSQFTRSTSVLYNQLNNRQTL